MRSGNVRAWLLVSVIASLVIIAASVAVFGQDDSPMVTGVPTATGKVITPAAATGAIFQYLNPGRSATPDQRAGQAAAVAVSPDGKLLAILTSGFNVYFGEDGKAVPELSTEYVFIFDITGRQPRQVQVLPLSHAFQGLAWAPSSRKLFASGGQDDTVVELVRDGSTFAAGRTFPLGHKACVGPAKDAFHPLFSYAQCGPETGGLAVSPDGLRLLVANLQNDSVSLVDLILGQVVAEQDLRPGIIDSKRRGEPGGSFPRSVAWTSATRAYVASERDREVISLAVSGSGISVLHRIPVHGQPVALLANRSGSRLYVALDTTDQVTILDTAHDRAIESLGVAAPESIYANTKMLGGANTNALVLTPDERTLLVSNGGENAVAVVRLSARARNAALERPRIGDRTDSDGDDPQLGFDNSSVIGLVPTGWYPAGVTTSKDGATWYVVNGKSEAGPNLSWCRQSLEQSEKACIADHRLRGSVAEYGSANGWSMLLTENQSVHQLEKAGFLTMPAPTPNELVRLTKQVARNNRLDQPERTAADERLFSFLREHIKHVIYIIKENRTYDQVFGDLGIGNGDPRLTLFPEKASPNHHAIARNFVTLDNLLVSGEVSWTGWMWTFAAQTTDLEERAEPLAVAIAVKSLVKGEGGPGLQGESAGGNRGINVGYATSRERHALDPSSPADPDILPGTHDVYAPDGPGGEEGKGFLWDAALRQGLTVRSWGVFTGDSGQAVREPHAQGLKVSWGAIPSLIPNTDPYYPDLAFDIPDYWRLREWQREFAEFSAAKRAPNLMLLMLPNDHFGGFERAVDGVNTPDTQMADNDYALGLLIETVANSPFAKDTLVVSIEDDACDGPDHVDAHRSVALFAGPYVRQHALISTRYTTVNVVKTIEDVLGIGPIGLNDALAAPMSDVFDPNAAAWSYEAIVPEVLYSTKLPLPPTNHAVTAVPRHSAPYWTKVMAGQDFSGPDRVDPVTFNRTLWRGLKGDEPYPTRTTEANPKPDPNLVVNRLLKSAQAASIPY